MKNYKIILICILFSSGLFAQGVYNNGGKIVIGTGTSFNIAGTGGNYRNETNVTDGSIDLSGTLMIAGNVTNNVAATDILTTAASGSTVVFDGTALQTLGGSTTAAFNFANLTVNGTIGVIVSKNAQVNGNLTLTNGVVEIGNNNFTFGPTATVVGIPSATNMIIAIGGGQVLKYWPAVGSFTFPVGDFSLSSTYSPVTLNFTSGTFAPGAIVGVNLVASKFNDPSITGSYLNRYWNITQTGITAFACDATFQYLATDITGIEADISTLRMLPLPVTVFNPASVATHQLSATGLTDFGTFTGGPGNKMLNLTTFLEGPFNGTTAMNSTLNGTPQLIPLTQPFNVAPWNYAGAESVTAIPAGVVDWVLVELRDAATPATATTSFWKKACFLKSDGTIVDLDGLSLLNMGRPTIANNLYVIVRHGNHLGIMSATGMALTGNNYSYNFTTAITQAYGGAAGYKEIVPGIFGMVAGDADADGQISVLDFSLWATDFGNIGVYSATDMDMDGQISVLDFSKWATNFGITTPVLGPHPQVSYKSQIPE